MNRPLVGRAAPSVSDRIAGSTLRQLRSDTRPTRATTIWTLGLLGTVASLAACGSIEPEETWLRVERGLDHARARVAADEDDQARQLLLAVERIDPDDASLIELKAIVSSDPAAERVHDTPWLGVNRARRLVVHRPVWARVLLYLPDRILDLLDLFSFDVHVGPGLFLDLHVTRVAQVGVGGRFVGGLGWHEGRSLGGQFQGESALNIPFVGTSAYLGGRAGTSGLAMTRQAIFDLHRPSDPMYQEWRDYWAVGVAATAGVAGVDFDLHPLELVDFIVGFATIDFLRDDFAETTGLGLTGAEVTALRDLYEVGFSAKAVAAYREWADARR